MADSAALYPPREASDDAPPGVSAGDDVSAERIPFRQIFEEHAVLVGRTLRYLGVAEADLTDAAQEVFVVVNRRYGDFEGRSTVSTWIHAICLRVAMNYRKAQRRRREDVVPEPPDARIEADQQLRLERREERSLLTTALDVLDDGQREIIVLHEIERLPMREVAELVGCPLQTAYTRRKAALDKMRGELKRRRTDDEKA